jgi:hypothetical protein
MGRLLRPKLEEGGRMYLQNFGTFTILNSITSLRVIILKTFFALVEKLLHAPKRNAVKIFAVIYDIQE